MSLQSDQIVETISSQDISNTQISHNNDLFSDASVEDLFSDLPDVFIEKLLDLERPSVEAIAARNEERPILIDKVETEAASSPPLIEPTQNTIANSSNSFDEGLLSISNNSLDSKKLIDDADFLDLPTVVEDDIDAMNKSDPSSFMEDVDFDLNILEYEEVNKEQQTDTTLDTIPNKIQSMEIDDSGSTISTQPLPLPPSVSQPPRRISLRARTKIQLEPFTLEASKYKELMKYTSAKSKVNDIVNDNDDDSDIDFTPSNTQAVDEVMDDISTYQDTQDLLSDQQNKRSGGLKKPISNKVKGRDTVADLSKRLPLIPSNTNAASTSRSLGVSNLIPKTVGPSNTSGSALSTSQTADSVDDVFNFEKYGLNQLIIPPPRRNREKGKNKVITFSKKKKGSSKSRSRNESRVPSRFMEKPSKDIFDFDFAPKSTFNLLKGTTTTPQVGINETQSTGTYGFVDYIDDPIEGFESPPESPQLSSFQSATINIDTDEEMIENDEVPVFKRMRKRKRVIFDSDDEEETDEQNIVEKDYSPSQTVCETEETDSIFDFPSDIPESSRSHLRIRTENDIVPIVDDEFEYKENKRQRFSIKDLKKNTLKNVLPASFYKVNQRKIEEEERLREQRKREAKANKAAKKLSSSSNSTNIPSASDSRHSSKKVNRDTEDVFAAFRDESEQSDEYEDYYGDDDNIDEPHVHAETDNHLSIFDDVVELSDTPSPSAPIDLTKKINNSRSKSFGQPIVNTRKEFLSPAINVNNRSIPTMAEAAEDNRVTGHRYNSKRPAPRPRKSNSKSSIAIVKPNNTKTRIPNLIQIKQNPTPSTKRRRKLKRTRDDIYIHEPYYRSYRTGNMPNALTVDNNVSHQSRNENNVINREFYTAKNMNNSRGMFVNNKLPRRPFDDIYMNTKQQLWYKKDLIYIGNYDISEYFDQRLAQVRYERPKPTIYTLQYVTKQVEKLMDHELRRVIGIRNTVYWHHHLLQPLLSDTPNRASAYHRFKETYSSLMLFDQVYYWKQIHPRKGSLLTPLFSRVFDDLKHMCDNDALNKQHDLDGELPGHDHFYVFVSICLTQWVPLYPYESKLQLAEMYANQIRGLTTMVSKLVEGREFETIPWRAIIKVLLFALDWTCRLHHLGIDKDLWSVAECIKILMDVLVYIGYDAIRSSTESRDYVIEAWICIIQILSVSDRQAGGYFYNEHIFIAQLTDSINKKSRVEELEFEKRKTTRLWAESLSLILTKHMMLL